MFILPHTTLKLQMLTPKFKLKIVFIGLPATVHVRKFCCHLTYVHVPSCTFKSLNFRYEIIPVFNFVKTCYKRNFEYARFKS